MRSEAIKITEEQIQDTILDYLLRCVPDKIGAFWRARPPQYIRAKGGSQGFKLHVTEPGIADIMGCYRGKCVGLEVKSAKGRIRESQKIFCKRLEAAGGHYFIVRSVADVAAALESIRGEG